MSEWYLLWLSALGWSQKWIYRWMHKTYICLLYSPYTECYIKRGQFTKVLYIIQNYVQYYTVGSTDSATRGWKGGVCLSLQEERGWQNLPIFFPWKRRYFYFGSIPTYKDWRRHFAAMFEHSCIKWLLKLCKSHFTQALKQTFVPTWTHLQPFQGQDLGLQK